MSADRDLVAKTEAVFSSITSLCTGLSDEEWQRPTECPGWSVQDNLSHLVAIESTLLGRPAPDHQLAEEPAHIKNPMGRMNEVPVDYRRSWPGEKVLDEWREVTAARLTELKGYGEGDFARETNTPVGPGQVRDFLAIRILDCWAHEQDMRRALGRPGHMDGPVIEHTVGRAASAMPMVVGKKAAAPEGCTVVFDVTGPAGRTLAIAVEGGRAKVVDEAPSPTVTLTMDVETFCCLGFGRWDPDQALADAKVTITGDQSLGKTLVQQMSFMI